MRVNNETKHTTTRLLIGEALPADSEESSVTWSWVTNDKTHTYLVKTYQLHNSYKKHMNTIFNCY